MNNRKITPLFEEPSVYWHGKPYYSLDAYCKNTFGEKIYKISLDAGFTCPNRDGTLDNRGCIFCSKGGSGDFAEPLTSPEAIRQALSDGKMRLAGKQTGSKFIAYFQAYTNTYGPVSYLEALYTSALSDESVVGISIATRPDCIPDDVLHLLENLRGIFPHKFIWIELGLQTIHDKSAGFIRRGYPLSCFEDTFFKLHALDIPVIVHLILGLPGENRCDMLRSISYLNSLPVWGVKLQLLHILKDTDLATLYQKAPKKICTFPNMEDYLAVLIDCIERLRPDMVLHRITGDAPKSLLLSPLWSSDKKGVLNTLHKEMKARRSYQGKCFYENQQEDLCQNP